MVQAMAPTNTYIAFAVAGATYAVRSTDVQHMEMVEHVTPVPNAAPFVEGVVVSRGQVVPVVNLRARFGFGEDVAEILRKGFAVPLAGPRDIFYAAISQGADLCIEDLGAEKIRPHVPQWYQELAAAHGLVLFPVLVNHRPVALIYADADTPETLHFQPEELNLLKTLRNQAVLAIKQRS